MHSFIPAGGVKSQEYQEFFGMSMKAKRQLIVSNKKACRWCFQVPSVYHKVTFLHPTGVPLLQTLKLHQCSCDNGVHKGIWNKQYVQKN